ncbi:LytR C-terminal domain-containing protein [Nocardioides renjunii]|uniref:LytR C-terminal domain-containing protein n=1 Tax=Nocardioides renjunii TaxID=3095075 RepID=UPI002AFEA70D|nr:LytR C-terminal domain-containing protein [Nocardioides sp. S-34]WQQ23059.1 LytR C-terminal domain-containing protein [Nocardioides sp. S-34]
MTFPTFPRLLRSTSALPPRRGLLRRPRDERGVAFPSPLVMLSVLAVAMASITFVATRDQAPTERRVDNTATIASADQSPSAEPSDTAVEKPKPKPEPRIKRGEVYVEVFNNSGIKGLAATTAAKATGVGWAVVGEDNWYGVVPTTTVYFPPRLRAAGEQLALDLGIKRTAPAVGVMKRDRLTIILTTDAPQ